MPKTKLRVCFIDDDVAVQKSLQLAATVAGYDSISFGSAHEFLAGFDAKEVFCIVLDVQLPGMSGLELQEVLRARRTHIPVVILTGHGNIPLTVRAMKNGAQEVLEKPLKLDVLKDQLQKARDLYAVWQKVERERQQIANRIEQLTQRELEVLDSMESGAKNIEIAKRLGISRKTLDIHRSRVVAKMKARSWADLARWRLLHDCGPGGAVFLKPGGYLPA
jgi:two-component system response regulator FixJ